METEKMQFNMASGEKCSEIILREGAAPKVLDPKPPVKQDINGTIGTIREYLSKRVNAGQFEQKDCYITVDRENVRMTLVINEADEYRRGSIRSILQLNPQFVKFGINQAAKSWTPAELGLFFKMNRTFFADRKENMELVFRLMNFNGTVQASIERDLKMNGSRTDNYAQIVNSNLPESFTLRIPIFKGLPAETLEVETFAQIDGRDVQFVLMSPGAQATLEEIRDKVLDEEIAEIREIAPDIAIIEI